MMSKNFSDIYAKSDGQYYNRSANWLIEAAQGAFKPGKRVLDLGCGDGRNSIPLAEIGFEIIAVDIERAAFPSLTDTAIRRGVLRNFVMINADIKRISFEIEFGIVIIATVLDNIDLPEIPDLIEKSTKLVEDGGYFYLSYFTTCDPACPSSASYSTSSETLDASRTFLRPGESIPWLDDFDIVKHFEGLEEDLSHGEPHFHGIERILAQKR